MKQRERIVSLDLVRVFSCLCVIICHFNASVGVWDNGLVYPQNSIIPGWYFEGRLYTGDVGVSLFFMLSGAALMMTYKPNDLRNYYKKRFLNIFPLYWLVLFITTAIDYFQYKGISGADKLWLLSTLTGIDGYIGCHGLTGAYAFHKVGEWFLGCILLLYLVFPLVLWAVERKPALTFLCASVIAISFMRGVDIGGYSIDSKTFFVRIPEMILGMMFIKYGMRERPWLLLLIGGCSACIAILVRQWIPPILFQICICIFLFALLVVIGEKIKSIRIKRILISLGALTYPVFLIHHWLSNKIVVGFDLAYMPRRSVYFMFLTYMILTLCLSKLSLVGSKKIVDGIKRFFSKQLLPDNSPG